MYFIRFKLLDGQAKLNLDRVAAVTLHKDETNRKQITILLDDDSYLCYTEGITIEDAEELFNKFPC